MMIACASSNLIWTVPLVPGCTHALQVVVRDVGRFLLVIISHADAVNVLRLSFADDCTDGLRHVVGAHRRILLAACCIILIEIHLIHITDTVLSHLILRRHRHRCIFCGSIRWLVHHLHLLITEVAHFIVMHC